jgi:glycosidase
MTALAGSLMSGACAAAQIDRVEPPSWWLGFEMSELQLLVYGTNIGQADPVVDHPGVTVSRVERVASPNYLFVYLDIDKSAETGEFPIDFETASGTVTYTYELLRRRSESDRLKGFDSSDVIYLVTPDRFANGDPANDAAPELGDLPDRSDNYGRHGGDIEGIRRHLDYIADMGFTSIWLNPVLENRQPRASYHGYATTDYYRVDPRFGSNESYREFITEARKRGVGVVMDLIVNHIGSGHWWISDLPSGDWLNFPYERVFSTHARTTNQDPYASEYDKKMFSGGWFAETMPDLNQRNPLLADYLVQNAIWWIEYSGIHGIRQDTYPYPDKDFMSEWTRRIMHEYPEFSIVGEEWSPNPNVTSYWQRGKVNHDGYVSHLTHPMDFPLQVALKESLTGTHESWESAWVDVYEMLGNDYLYPDPQSLMIFADNHDMDRIFTQLDEDYDQYRMAMVFYLTMRGVPQIFYGTEILLSHPGTSSHGALRMDFPGGWAGDEINGFTGEGLSAQQLGAQQLMRKLLNWRKDKQVIHSGKLMQFAPIDDVYAYFRYDDNDTVMVVFNRGAETISVDAERFRERLGDANTAVDVITGKRFDIDEAMSLEPHSVLLLEIEK